MNALSSDTKTRTIQAVIFDLDGVLMDSEWLAYLAWREVAETHGGQLPESTFAGMIGLTQEETAAYVVRVTGVQFDIPASCAYTWQRVIEMLSTEIEPLPGSVELVRALAGRGYPLAIASNAFNGYIQNALKGLKVNGLFSALVGVDQVAQGKPAPDVYLRAAEELGIAPANCLAVEDSLVGMRAAAAAGLRVLAVPDSRANHTALPDAWRVYPSLVEVLQDLDTILNE